MLNNVYNASCTHIVNNEAGTIIEFNGEIVAKDRKDATYKVQCILREYIKDTQTLGNVKVYLTPVSTIKQLVRNVIPDKIRVHTH